VEQCEKKNRGGGPCGSCRLYQEQRLSGLIGLPEVGKETRIKATQTVLKDGSPDIEYRDKNLEVV
jgi:hypothetical protein